jgi:hypothetical protein
MYLVTFNEFDYDLWARLSVGKIFFQIGSVLKNDIFSYTETKPVWIDHEWGSGVVFYFFADRFGDAGLLMLKIAGIFLVLFLISKIIELQSTKTNSHLNILWYFLIFLVMFNGIASTVRSQLFTFIFFTLWIYILERVRRGETRLLWIIPATSLIWANLHGGFVSGLGLLGIYGIGEFINKKPFKKYFLTLIPAILITIINPYGFKYWEYILYATTLPRTVIAEWMPTPLFGPIRDWGWFKLLLIMTLISTIFTLFRHNFRFKNLDKVKYLLILVTLCLALKHIKHHPLFAISAGSLLYYEFYGIFSTFGNCLAEKFGMIFDKALKNLVFGLNILIFTLIIIFGSMIIFIKPLQVSIPAYKYPIGSVEFIKKNNLSGNLLAPFHWGSYLAWKLYPQCLIPIDGRYEEVYPDKIDDLTANFDYVVDKNWYKFIDTYHTDILLLDKHLDSYIAILNTGFWKKIYDDKISAVFVPAHKAKKSYIIPVIGEKNINQEKYNTEIDFLRSKK